MDHWQDAVRSVRRTRHRRLRGKVKAWAKALLSTDAVTGSVAPEFDEAFVANLKRREFYVGTLFDEKSAAAE